MTVLCVLNSVSIPLSTESLNEIRVSEAFWRSSAIFLSLITDLMEASTSVTAVGRSSRIPLDSSAIAAFAAVMLFLQSCRFLLALSISPCNFSADFPRRSISSRALASVSNSSSFLFSESVSFSASSLERSVLELSFLIVSSRLFSFSRSSGRDFLSFPSLSHWDFSRAYFSRSIPLSFSRSAFVLPDVSSSSFRRSSFACLSSSSYLDFAPAQSTEAVL